MKSLHISVVGATGAAGGELIKSLETSKIPVGRLRLFASSNSRGRHLKFRGYSCLVESLDEIGAVKTDIAFFSAGEGVSAKWAPRFAAEGALVIDNSNAFRMNPDVPLVVPQVNPTALATRPRFAVVANPSCSTIQLVRALRPLIAAFDVHQILLTSYQAASEDGQSGINELLKGSRTALEGGAGPCPNRFPVPLPFNVIPQIGAIAPDGMALEERNLLQESRKIFGKPHLRLTSTCVQVPVVNGHSEAVYIEFDHPVRLERIHELLAGEPGIRLYQNESHDGFPTPRFLADCADVHIGRVRVNPEDPRGLWIWVVADNLRFGAALNALLIAKLAIANDLTGAT